MSGTLRFLRRHWLTLVLLAASLLLVNWIVSTKRPPGAMTVIEAQAMDMTTMKPPLGVFPVASELVSMRDVAGEQSYPATVHAYNDEDVVARIAGRVTQVLVYPGDEVHQGQLLARLEADEIGSEAAQSQAVIASSQANVVAAEQMVKQKTVAIESAESNVRQKKAATVRVQADLEAAKAEVDRAAEARKAAEAKVAETEADVTYAQQELKRERKLYEAGAISLDELQSAERDVKAAGARVERAKAEVRASKQAESVAQKRVQAAKSMLDEAKAAVGTAEAEVKVQESNLDHAEAQAKASKAQARASEAGAAGAGAIASYRELRALEDGIVSERVISPGTSVMAGQAVLRLKVLDKVRVQADLPQSLAGKVRVGSMVEVATDSVRREGKITSVFPVVNDATRTFTVEAVFHNQDQSLLPGMYARMIVHTSDTGKTLAVKDSAIMTAQDGSKFVWVISEKEGDGEPTDWTCTMHPQVSKPGPGLCPICNMDLVPRTRSGKYEAKRKAVHVGVSNGEYTEVLDGLERSDEVIWAGHEDLYEGAPIESVEWGMTGPKQLPSGAGMSEMDGHDHGAADDEQMDIQAQIDAIPAGIWYCPMHPEVQQDGPGTCPICHMDLVEKQEDGS